MPRENRKRGKKHKKPAEDFPPAPVHQEEELPETREGPSWIVSGPSTSEVNEEAPFGYVDSEVKAYFRTVDVQIREWQEEGHQVATEPDTDPNEDRRLFFVAALDEMSGKEKELATDPDCSNILERMAYSMDDFARRVFMDRLTGSYKTLVKHRFASHVCQTFLEVASDTVARECRGILPPNPASSSEGELMLMKDIILDICEELSPDFSSLIMDPFASHVLRAVLAVLSPHLFPLEQKSSALRSKKSAAYKARQGSMKSVFSEAQPTQPEAVKTTPPEFSPVAVKFVKVLRENLGANEVRALAASQVASPVLQMLLEIEADQGLAYEPNSLADRVLDGLIAQLHESGPSSYEASDYVGTLLRDPTSSHLLETLVRCLPHEAFGPVWQIYLGGKLARLATHPVANFVVAKAFERVNEGELKQACEELNPVSEKIFKSSRTGVVRALIDRAAQLHVHEGDVVKVILEGLNLSEDDEERKLLVPCVLRLLTAEDYKKAKIAHASQPEKQPEEAGRFRRNVRAERNEDPMAPKTQGAILLQSMLRLPQPHNQAVLDSISALTVDEQIAMAHDVTASRVLDAVLDSVSVPFKAKRKFVMDFIGQYHILVDDRIGSRVGDRCWAFADPFLKEKIGRSLIPHERTLVGSFYGKFFARNLNLYLLQRDPEQWKNFQSAAKAAAQAKAAQPQVEKTPVVASESLAISAEEKSKKRKARPEDEIDILFEEKLGKKVKKAGLGPEPTPKPVEIKKEDKRGKEKKRRKKDVDDEAKDKGLEDVLGAIRLAPKDEKSHRKKKKA